MTGLAHSFPDGSIILTPAGARTLYHAARLEEVRSRYRLGDPDIRNLLNAIGRAAFPDTSAGGIIPRQFAASDENGNTTQAIARRANRSERTVRLACERGILPAHKYNGTWVIEPSDAARYIRDHRKS